MTRPTNPDNSFIGRTKRLHLGMPLNWSGTVKHIVTVLFTFAGSTNGGGICASVGTIAKHAGEQERTVERVLHQLRTDGFLADDGWRVFNRPSGDKVRVKTRRLVLAAIARTDAIETDTGDGFGAPIETDIYDGFDHAPHAIEPDIFTGSLQVEPDISGHSLRVEPDTGDTQTESKREPRERVNRESATRARINGADGRLADKAAAAPSRQPRPSRRKPETPIDPSWQPDGKGVAFAKDKDVTDLPGEVERFRDYHLARDSRMRDWPAAWRTWCSNDRKFRERRGSSGNSRKQQGESKLGWLADHFGRGEGET